MHSLKFSHRFKQRREAVRAVRQIHRKDYFLRYITFLCYNLGSLKRNFISRLISASHFSLSPCSALPHPLISLERANLNNPWKKLATLPGSESEHGLSSLKEDTYLVGVIARSLYFIGLLLSRSAMSFPKIGIEPSSWATWFLFPGDGCSLSWRGGTSALLPTPFWFNHWTFGLTSFLQCHKVLCAPGDSTYTVNLQYLRVKLSHVIELFCCDVKFNT